ncbi:MAG: ABC transporter permease [Bacteroidota bacterium]|nr:ABC transporter permease [Bacteroidota bacterium]
MKAVPSTKKYIFSKGVDQYFTDVYKAWLFVKRFFKEAFKPPFHFREIVNQCYEIGLKSLPLITLTGFVTGIVFTKQSRPSLAEFGATSWLPNLISIAIVRALASLVTALICAGKIGSSIGAELSSMKVTEQIEAMEVSAINPFKYLACTRILACTITVPILGLYCGFVALMGSYFSVHANEATSFVTFFKTGFAAISFLDVFSSIIKSTVFGFTIGVIGCYKGFNATSGTRGVGRAANQAVVLAMFLVFIEEIVIVQIANWIRYF